MESQYNMNNLGEVDVIYKYQSSLADRPSIKNSSDAISVLKELYNHNRIGLQEQFIVVYVNRANKVIGCTNLFCGGSTSTVVDLKIILALGLKLMASGVLISHNHPSGNLTASEEDIKLTKKIKQALVLMDMILLDHIIVDPNYKFISFAEEGIIP
jgi:DNA repair protein RadC